MNKVNRFLTLIFHVVERPGIYGVNEVDDLYFIMFGYQYADLQSMEDISNLLSGFRRYVNEHFELKGDHDWPRLIKLYSASDRHSIELFGLLFRKYLDSINISIPD